MEHCQVAEMLIFPETVSPIDGDICQSIRSDATMFAECDRSKQDDPLFGTVHAREVLDELLLRVIDTVSDAPIDPPTSLTLRLFTEQGIGAVICCVNSVAPMVELPEKSAYPVVPVPRSSEVNANTGDA